MMRTVTDKQTFLSTVLKICTPINNNFPLSVMQLFKAYLTAFSPEFYFSLYAGLRQLIILDAITVSDNIFLTEGMK